MSEPEEQLPQDFKEVLRRMVNTPPHKQERGKRKQTEGEKPKKTEPPK